MANSIQDLNIEENFEKATKVLRKGVLAYVGMNVVAFETARERMREVRKSFDEALNSTDGLFERCVVKGEEIEAQAGETLQDVRSRVQDRVKSFTANDRSVEIKVKTKGTKPAAKKAPAKKTAVKKTATKKPAAKKVTVKATAKKKAA